MKSRNNNKKKMKMAGIVLAILICLPTAGCSKGGNTASGVSTTGSSIKTGSQDSKSEAYYFEYKGIKIKINDPTVPVLKALGEPLNYFEAKSCAFDGMDKIYTYPGFELHTYTEKNVDYIFSVLFTDDSVSTREGIALNATLKDITAKYGTGYEKSSEQYTYLVNGCKLSFLLENDAVASIEYSLKVAG